MHCKEPLKLTFTNSTQSDCLSLAHLPQQNTNTSLDLKKIKNSQQRNLCSVKAV